MWLRVTGISTAIRSATWLGVFKSGSKTSHNRLADEKESGFKYIEFIEECLIVVSYPSGSVLVPRNPVYSDEWAFIQPHSPTMIGFNFIDNDSQYWLMSPVIALISMLGVAEAQVAMDSLLHALHQDRKEILERWVIQRKGDSSRMAFLCPVIETIKNTGDVKNRFFYCSE